MAGSVAWAVEFVGRDFAGVPLAEIEVLLGIDSDIVAIVDEIFLFHQWHKLPVFAARNFTTGAGNEIVDISGKLSWETYDIVEC